MSKYLDFTGYTHSDLTSSALENYLVHGLEPGSFMISVLCNDLVGAVSRADHWNKQMLPDIVGWIRDNAPAGSWGCPENVLAWLRDEDGRRTRYVERLEKTAVWNTLSEE